MNNALETRRNFAETAFFYPNIQTNEEGEASSWLLHTIKI